MYNNPNLNILLMTPGRTGSVTIVYYLSQVACVTPKVRYWYQNSKPLESKELLHSHRANDVHLANEHTLFILSTRNLIECTYSRVIGDKMQKWRYIQNQGTVQPFSITTDDYLEKYEENRQFYLDLKDIIPKNTLQIDYSQFKDDHKNLLSILNIPEKSYIFARKDTQPTKTPGTYRDWIINFDEIDELAKTLDPIPPI